MCKLPEEGDRSTSVTPRRRPQHASSSPQSSTSTSSSPFPVDDDKYQKSSTPRWTRQRRLVFSFLLLVGIGLGSITLSTRHLGRKIRRAKTEFLFHPSFHSVKIDPPKRVSDFSMKPRMVGYLDIGEKDEIKTSLLSKYRPAIRIHPTTFAVTLTATERTGSRNGRPFVVSGRRSLSNSLWQWGEHFLDPMSETSPFPEGGLLLPQPEETKDPCQLPHEWMKHSFPTCNHLHEQGMMAQLIDPHRKHPQFLMGQGSMRSVWLLEDSTAQMTVLKTLRLKRSFDDDNHNRHNRDALISERLTGSPHFLNIFGYCGQSAVYQYAPSGNLYDAIGAKEYRDEVNDEVAQAQWRQWSNQRKLDVAMQVVSAVADLHDIDHDGRPSVAHDDLDVTQFVSSDGGQTFQLSDFNGSPFLKWNFETQETCPFHALMHGGKTRSPEEYANEWVTEKLDVFAMGNILYTIVVGAYPFKELGHSEAAAKVMEGVLPIIPEHIQHDKDPMVQALLKAMQLCWKKDPAKRASAAQVKKYLSSYVETGTAKAQAKAAIRSKH